MKTRIPCQLLPSSISSSKGFATVFRFPLGTIHATGAQIYLQANRYITHKLKYKLKQLFKKVRKNLTKMVKMQTKEAGEMVQQLRALAALTMYPDSVPCTHNIISQLQVTIAPKNHTPSYGLCRHRHTYDIYTYMLGLTHTHKNK